jgi:membrane protease YdiL (CAAX protease family)
MQTATIDSPTQAPTFRWSLIDVLLITASSILLIFLGTWALGILYKPSLTSQTSLNAGYIAAITALEGIALMASIYLFGVLRKRITWQEVGFRPIQQRWMKWASVIALAFIPVIGLIALLIQLALGMPLENPQLEFLVPQDFNWLGAISMIILGGVVVPIAEEAFFRGVVYSWMRQHSPAWVAILLSSAIFGALHGEISVAGATFVMGIILAWFYERSHSLWAPITIHILNNSLKLILLYFMLAAGVQIPPIA